MAWETSDRRLRLPPDWPAIRRAVKARAGGRCEYVHHVAACNGRGTDADHITPGDDHTLGNLQWLHRSAPTPPAPALQAAADLYGVPIAHVIGPPRPGFAGLTVAERLRWAAIRATAANREAEVLDVVTGWVQDIERLLDPPTVVRLRGVECPACGVTRTPIWDDDQDAYVDTPALTITMGTQPHARCAECGATWTGPEVVDLAAQCGGSTATAAHALGG